MLRYSSLNKHFNIFIVKRQIEVTFCDKCRKANDALLGNPFAKISFCTQVICKKLIFSRILQPHMFKCSSYLFFKHFSTKSFLVNQQTYNKLIYAAKYSYRLEKKIMEIFFSVQSPKVEKKEKCKEQVQTNSSVHFIFVWNFMTFSV